MALSVSIASFLESYPEFTNAGEKLLRAKLAEASMRTNVSVFGTPGQATAALMLRTCILLYKSPWARALRQENPDQIGEWSKELRGLQRGATFGQRVF